MAARALWKAVLQIGSTALPVRMYSAVQERSTRFHLLHASDHVRVHERMRRVDDGQIVEHADARSGYVLDTGEVVLLERKEVAALAPKPSRDITLLHCASAAEVPPAAFARPYWLGPDGDEAAYFGLAEALRESQQLAIVAWVMRNKQHFGALSEREGRLTLVELRSSDQWLDSKGLQNPDAHGANAREVSMAQQLISGLEGPFEHASFHDSYREQVETLVQTKARGGKVPKARAPRRSAPAGSLASALQASLQSLKQGNKPRRGRSQERKSA